MSWRVPSPTETPDNWGDAGGLRRRATWSLVDQALSSLTNFAMSLIAAHLLAPREFGAFALAFGTYLVFLNLNRAFATDALLIRYSSASDKERRDVVPAVMGTVVGFSVLSSLCCVGAALILPSPTNIGFLAFAFVQPGILMQDSWRFVFFADGRPQLAAVNDLIWAGIQAVLTVAAIASGHTSLLWLTAAWGIAAWVAAGVGFLQYRAGIALRRAMSWVKLHRDLSFRYAADVLTLIGVAQLGIYGLGLLTGLPAVGSIRGAQVLLGPLTFISLGGSIIIVPEGVRLRARAPDRLRMVMAAYSAVMVMASIAWVVVAGLLGAHLGERFVGQNWSGVRSVLVPIGALFVFGSLADGGLLGLRVLGDARRALYVRLAVAPFTLAASLIGAALAGGRGFAIGSAAAVGLGALVWWAAFIRSDSSSNAEPQDDETQWLPGGRLLTAKAGGDSAPAAAPVLEEKR
jgi:O-antigen/teichoic acid export membrane protein